MSTPTLPRSVTGWYDPFLTALGPLVVYVLCASSTLTTHELCILLTVSALLPVCLAEYLRQRRHFPMRPVRPFSEVLRDACLKFIGTAVGVAAILFLWWLLPIYDKPHYRPLFQIMHLTMLWVLALSFVAILYTEWRLGAVKDQTWQLTLLALGRWHEIDLPLLKTALIGLLVRAIFLPLNLCGLVEMMEPLRSGSWDFAGMPWPQMHAQLVSMNWMLLIVAIIPGYLFSMRLLGTGIRRADASWFGWAVTLACYPPLLDGVFRLWLNYSPLADPLPYHKPWVTLTSDFMPLFILCSCIILLLEAVHWWGEAMMGLRASNLTHRGVITNGPFRYTRHPIYVSKCLGWLVIAMPFAMGGTLLECVRLTLLWGCVCLLYYGRAWVEERLFSTDPDYIAYARWIDRHGVLAWAGKYCPPLTFEWKLKRWQESGAVSRETVP